MGIKIQYVICIILAGNVLWNDLDGSSKERSREWKRYEVVCWPKSILLQGESKFYLLGNSGEHGCNIL